ncbi:hypothetical protein FGB62_5g318 [Gracilaria domingensis]|nr:hypothetical protein FGB62_5g318 [Gracilaria domingensis]
MDSVVGSHPTMPFSIREALHGNHGLEPCVRNISHKWNLVVLQRLRRFEPIIDRPKQALQHLFELFILHVCQLDISYELKWVDDLVQYLAAISQHLIPAVKPEHSVQWGAAVYDERRKIVRYMPQREESYPKRETVNSREIIDIISRYSQTFAEPDISKEELSRMPGLMDEPAKTAIMVYAWYLKTFRIKNGWLRPYLNSPLGRRERHRNVPELSRGNALIAGGRLGRAGEELHTLYALAFLDTRGHLIWYTVRRAIRGEIIGGIACSYARGNNVRIHSSKDLRHSIQIRYDHICNFEVLDFRLWESWTQDLRSVGPCKSMGNRGRTFRAVRFDEPVVLEDALAVGFRIVNGVLVNPKGKAMRVVRGSDGLFRVHRQRLRPMAVERIPWHPRMRLM